MTTQQFKWKDRDTAAQDMLQLVYHAPPTISRLATSLLKAFRSTQILPQLIELVTDLMVDSWIRIYALRAYKAAPTDRIAIEFEPLARETLRQREELLDHPNRLTYRYLHPDLLDDLAELADEHPANRDWFFALIDTAHPRVAIAFLAGQFDHGLSQVFTATMLEKLLTLLNAHPDLLDLDAASSLLGDDEIAMQWLNEQFDAVLALCLAQPEHHSVSYMAHFWPRLNATLASHISGWDERERGAKRTKTVDYQQSPAYLFLKDLYDRASAGEKGAFGDLSSIALQWQGNVPMRAVSTHFIGKLHSTYKVFPVLAQQMRYGDVHSDDYRFDAPIRYEAGEALIQMPTVATWEVMVDSFFIHPRNSLTEFQIDWIAYVTDVLSGDDKPYAASIYIGEERRSWFARLSEISAEELEKLKL